MPVGDLTTDDAILFLWSTNTLLPDALKVIRAWGFEYTGNIVWEKDRLGLGYYIRNIHETLLIAKKGNMLLPEPQNRPRSVFRAPWRGHSVKPDESYEIIEKMYPDLPKLELFARQKRPNWDVWGNDRKLLKAA